MLIREVKNPKAFSNQLLREVSEHFGEFAVCLDDFTLHRSQKNPHRTVVQQRPVKIGRLKQRLLIEFVFGDLLMGPRHDQRLPVLTPCRHLTAIENPSPASVFVAHPGFAFVIVQLPGQMPLDHLAAPDEIIGVGVVDPGLNRCRSDLLESVADDLGPSLIKDGLAALDVPLPRSDIGPFDNPIQPFFLLREDFGHLIGQLLRFVREAIR